MPGLIGIVEATAHGDLKPIFERMLVSMQRGGRLLTETFAAPGKHWAFGRVHLGIFNPASQVAANESIHVLFHGDLSNEAELKKKLDREMPIQSEGTIASLIKALYRTYGNA